MNDDRHEREMRELFHALKRRDERIAPPFSRSCEGALARMRKPSRSRRLARVTAAAALGLLGVFGFFFMHPTRPPELNIVSGWQSPTAPLLKSLDDPLLKTVPRLDEPLVEIKLVTPEKGSGGSR